MMGRTHTLRVKKIGTVMLKFVMVDGVGYEVHSRIDGEGWSIVVDGKSYDDIEQAYERLTRLASVELASCVLGLST